MGATALTMGHDALWSLTVMAVVVGPPALVVAVVVWVTRRLTRRRTARTTTATRTSPAARVAVPPTGAAGG